MVLQNKIQMRHICYQVNEEHTISRLLQEVPFQINTHRYAETSSATKQVLSSHLSFSCLHMSCWLTAIFQKGRKLIQIRPVCTPWVFPYHLLDDNLEVQKTCIYHIDNIFSGLAPCPRIPDCPFFLELFFLSLLTSPKSNFDFTSLFLPNLLTIHCPCNIILSQSPSLKDQTSQERVPFSAPLSSLKNFP